MKITKKFSIIAVFLILAMGTIIGSIVYFITRPTEMENEMRPVQVDTTIEHNLNVKIQTLEEVIKQMMLTETSEEVQIILTEEELSVLLVKMMGEAMTESTNELSDGMVIDSTVNINPDEIKAVVDIEMYGISVQAGASLQASIDDQGISLLIHDLEISQLPFAGRIEERIADEFNQTHAHMNFDDLHIDIDKDLPVKLKNLILGNREIVVIGEVN